MDLMSSFLDWMKKSFLMAVFVEIGVYGDRHSTYITFFGYNKLCQNNLHATYRVQRESYKLFLMNSDQ